MQYLKTAWCMWSCWCSNVATQHYEAIAILHELVTVRSIQVLRPTMHVNEDRLASYICGNVSTYPTIKLARNEYAASFLLSLATLFHFMQVVKASDS